MFGLSVCDLLLGFYPENSRIPMNYELYDGISVVMYKERLFLNCKNGGNAVSFKVPISSKYNVLRKYHILAQHRLLSVLQERN